ncbi:MAG: hypothetical protein HC875_21515 [Anaerolineales bacterium]|nr:hypothetical protein [Anaerolineales bacterium]
MIVEKTKTPFTLSYHSSAEPRIPPEADILEDRWLHQVFLITHIPATWPAWKLAAGLLLAALVVWLIWLPLGWVAALFAAALYLIFALGDWLLLWWLPHSGRSFGPIGPQLYLKTAPRLGVAVVLAVVSLLTSAGCPPVPSVALSPGHPPGCLQPLHYPPSRRYHRLPLGRAARTLRADHLAADHHLPRPARRRAAVAATAPERPARGAADPARGQTAGIDRAGPARFDCHHRRFSQPVLCG